VSALALLAPILAAAGGGSSGFGGGGGGSSFSGGSSSSGSGGSGEPVGLVGTIVFITLVALVAGVVVLVIVQSIRLHRRRRARVAAVVLASAEAAEDDAHFAADVVTTQAAELFRTIQRAWSANDVQRLRALVGADLMVEWERRLADFRSKGWRNVVEVAADSPVVEYVGLVNREDDTQDRVCVRVDATLEDQVLTDDGQTIMRNGEASATTVCREYWTLEYRGDHWTLVSIESDIEGVHQLRAPIVASPWSDTTALRDEALVEGAVADKALEGSATADLVDVDLAQDARAQALDLSLADARFAPDVLEVAARRAVSAWMEAVDGEDHALLALAAPDAASTLLYGGDGSGRTRVVVRGARIERIAIDVLDAGENGDPATMTMTVRVRGRRYVEDRDTAAIVAGSKDAEGTFTERWTLGLRDGDVAQPWHLLAVADPVSG